MVFFRAAYAATGTNSGAVEVWDLPKSSVRHTLQHPVGPVFFSVFCVYAALERILSLNFTIGVSLVLLSHTVALKLHLCVIPNIP